MSIFSEEKEEAKSILSYFFEHGVKIIIAFVVGTILAICLTFLIPKKYRASGIIYPPNSFTRDQLISNPQFGHESETEQLMQLLESSTLRDRVVNEFDFISYYDIDSNTVGWKQNLNLKYIQDVQFFRSKYLSVIVSAELTKPERAAEVVNFIIDEVNNYKKNVFKDNRDAEISFYISRLERSKLELDSVVSIIYSIKDTSNRENLITNYKQRIATDNFIDENYIDSREMEQLIQSYDIIRGQTRQFQIDYEHAVDEMNKPLLKNYVVDRAVPTFKKISPSFITNGLIGGVLLTIIMILLFVIRDKYRTYKSQL
jgi:hypothetical protein